MRKKPASRRKPQPPINRAGAGKMDIGSGELIRMINRNNEVQELNVIIKADVQGSLTCRQPQGARD